MSDLQKHGFGLPVPAGITPTRAWGARAILRHEQVVKPIKRKGRTIGRDETYTVRFDLVADRSTYRGPDITASEAKAFFAWLDKAGIPELARAADKAGLGLDEDHEVIIDDGLYHLRANPRRSSGYLSIVAWED